MLKMLRFPGWREPRGMWSWLVSPYSRCQAMSGAWVHLETGTGMLLWLWAPNSGFPQMWVTTITQYKHAELPMSILYDDFDID